MSGETEQQVSGWTTDTLRMAVMERLAELDLRLAAEFHAADARLEQAIAAQHEIANQRVSALDQRLDRQFDSVESVALERVQAWRDMLIAAQAATAQRFAAMENASQAALDAAKEAVAVANSANEKRFDAVNEFRAQLGDQAATFLPRKEAQVVNEGFSERMQSLENRINAMGLSIERINAAQVGATNERGEIRAKSVSAQALIGTAIGVVLFVIAVAGFVVALVNNGGN